MNIELDLLSNVVYLDFGVRKNDLFQVVLQQIVVKILEVSLNDNIMEKLFLPTRRAFLKIFQTLCLIGMSDVLHRQNLRVAMILQRKRGVDKGEGIFTLTAHDLTEEHELEDMCRVAGLVH